MRHILSVALLAWSFFTISAAGSLPNATCGIKGNYGYQIGMANSLFMLHSLDLSGLTWIGDARLAYSNQGDSIVSETLISDGGMRRDFTLTGINGKLLQRIESRDCFLQIDSIGPDGHFTGNSRRYQSEHFYVDGNISQWCRSGLNLILEAGDTINNTIVNIITIKSKYYFSDPSYVKTDSLYGESIDEIAYVYCVESNWPIIIATCSCAPGDNIEDTRTIVCQFPLIDHPSKQQTEPFVGLLSQQLRTLWTATEPTDNINLFSQDLAVITNGDYGQINVVLSSDNVNETQVILCDVVGRVLQSAKANGRMPIIFRELPTGYYVIWIKSPKATQNQTIYVK